MKRFIMLSVMVMALCITVIGVARSESSDLAPDISDGLCVIASGRDMAKCGIAGKKLLFSGEDFKKSLNLSEISYITVTELPDVSEGRLCIGDVLLNEGQTVSAANLELLNYSAANEEIRESSFCFKANGNEYEMRCNIYLLTHENSAPTLDMEDEKIFSVSTHQTVKIFGKLLAYDPDGDELRYEIVSYAKGGTLELDSKSGEYSYTPTGSYFGEDCFEYVAVDKYGNYSSARRVNLTVEKLKTDTVYCDMEDHRDHHAALTMTEKGIMNGTTIGDSTYFMPDKAVSRVDFVVMLMHAIGVDEVESVADTGFDDDAQIPASMKGYVREARKMGLVTGSVNEKGEYLFEPSREISRAEAALIVSKLVDCAVPTVKPTFADKSEIPAWASDAIYTLNGLGIMTGENGNISATSSLTRAQTAKMLYTLMSYIE